MSYFSFDPRDAIRNQIGTDWDVDENVEDLEKCVVVSDDSGASVYIALLKPGQTRKGSPYEMPFIEMSLMTSPSTTNNVAGNVKFQEAYIDFHIWYQNEDNFTATDFGKSVADELCNLVANNRTSVASSFFMEVIDEGREILEPDGTTLHRVVEIYINNYYGE